MASTTVNDIFKEAHLSFLQLLSPEERTLFSTCSSADELLADAQRLEVISKNRARGRQFMQRITALSKILAPYFDIVGITVQTTEYAALAWGGIRLVLQLASNFTTFFDKLTVALERLANHIPQYDLIIRMYKGDFLESFAQRIANSLRDVYVDIFQFLQRVARVFSRKDGRNKLRPVVIASLAWQPFDSRFEEILHRMESHRTTLKEVLDLDHKRTDLLARERMEREFEAAKIGRENAEKGKNEQENIARRIEIERREQQKGWKTEIFRLEQMEKRFTEERENMLTERMRFEARRAQEALGKSVKEILQAQRDALILRIRDWLSPPEFVQDYEKALNSREDNTAEWLLDDDCFEEWKLYNSTRAGRGKFEKECLWIKGNPGYGKTVLAASAVSELTNEMQTDSNNRDSISPPEVLYFFFRSGISTMNSTSAAQRALLAQILHNHRQDSDIVDMFVFAMNETSSGQMIASEDELSELLRMHLRSTDKQCFIILDGIDECRENELLIQQLLTLREESEIKILLFSRPNVAPLSRTVPEERQLLIGRRTSNDIEIYLRRRLALLQDDGLLPRNANSESLVNHLLTGADGMFLWARLMISYLKCGALSRSQRVEIIENFILPEGLEAMYDRIGDLIGHGYQVERTLAKRIIMWLTFTERRLTITEIQGAINIATSSKAPGDDVADTAEFTEMVIMTCAGLVETETLYSPNQDRKLTFFRFIHLSASEYFSSETGHFASIFATKPWEANLEITCTCLDFLVTELPAQPLGATFGTSAVRESLDDILPFCYYAATFWIVHLDAAKCDISRIPHNFDLEIIKQLHRLFLHLSSFLSHGLLLMSWVEATYVFGKPPPFKQLNQWLRWANSLEELQFPDTINLPRLYDDIRELTRYLFQIHEDWGPKLLANPGCIWEEVTVFTPCRLLPQGTAATVHSLITEEPNSDYLSTQYLCKVSESSSDGYLVGVLSIWPSRKYQLFTQQKMKSVSLKTLRDLSTGWMARYEIWSLASEAKCTVDHKFSLDNTEVWLQMKQTMCQREDESGESIGWGMQFPMAISKNVRMFTILRALYSLKPAISKPGLILETSILHLEFDGMKNPHWSSHHEKIQSDDAVFSSTELEADERFQRRDLYLYWFFFHPTRPSLLFVSQDLQKKSMGAIFDLNTVPTISVLNYGELNVIGHLLRHPSWCRNFNQVKVVYHPRYPLLGFSFAGRLYLWAFLNSAEKPRPLCDVDPDSEINFSSDGSSIIFSDPLDNRKRITRVPHSLLQSQQMRITWHTAPTELQVSKWTKNTHWKTPARDLQDIEGCRSSTPLQIQDQGSFRLHHSQDNNLSVQLRGDAKGSREIMKLPNWARSGQANINLQIPQSKDEMMRVILNKSAKPWYGMSESVDTHLPAIIQLDPGQLGISGLAITDNDLSK